jgi:pimeloyl-ACP methyl ester carboxylesterase
MPLLLIHGWPGSLFEVTKVLTLLKARSKSIQAFHAVGPSLVNFGFSLPVERYDVNLSA